MVMPAPPLAKTRRRRVAFVELAAVFALAFLLSPTPALAGITYPAAGTLGVHTRWTLADSPVELQGSLTVAPAINLEIDPGVSVLAVAGTRLTIHGSLRAIGTPELPVCMCFV
jgi:hypothetical protein